MLVLVAVAMPVLLLFASFAIDAGHWYDYSRNLQNRADAAALAAGDQLAICLGSPSASDEAGIGKTAQEYSGPPSDTPLDSLVNLPYGSAAMAGFTPYLNPPNLSAGKGPDFHLLLNHTDYWPNQTNDSNGYGNMGSYCTATDPTDPSVCPAANNPTGCPIVDVRETQANVPMFIGLVGLHPNISAHARVQLELITGGNAVPVGVGDAGQSSCVFARIVDETNQNAGPNSNGVLAAWALTQDPTTKLWSGALPAGSFTVPSANDQLGLQGVIPGDCTADPATVTSADADVYDAPTNGPNAGFGITFINTYTPLNPPVSNPARGSVWLEQRGCTSGGTNDPYFYYFTSGTCTVRVHAQVDFPTGNYSAQLAVDGGSYAAMTADGTDAAGNQLWYADFTVPFQSGRHNFALGWSLNGGAVTQFNSGKPLQATFAAFSDGTGTDDSGPIVEAHVGCAASCPNIGGSSTTGATSGVDSLPVGSSPQLTATFKLLGLQQSSASDKPTLLRSSVTTSQRTGAFDCGQGTDANQGGLLWVMEHGGCGLSTIAKSQSALTSSLTVYNGSLTAYSGSGQWPFCAVLTSNPISCGEPVTGQQAGPVHDAIAFLICGDSKCQNTPSGRACNYWQAYKNGTGPLPNGINDPGDPRAIAMAITTPQDLLLPANDPRWIRIVGFATFYVTGWVGDPYDPSQPGSTAIPGCGSGAISQDESYPNAGKLPNTAVWGHFIEYVFPGQQTNGEACPKDQIGNCTPALTR